jgi:hypothetical protein
MDEKQQRAVELFPAVLLSVLGVIQALAFELLWEEGLPGLARWRAADATATGVLQAAAVFQGGIVMWALYASLVLRLRWVPSIRDLVVPFLLGALQFALVELMAPANLPWWFAVLALVFALAIATNYAAYAAAARLDPVSLPEAGQQALGSYVPSLAIVAALAACAALVAWTGPASPVALGAVLAANAGLLTQLLVLRRYWNRDLRLEP